MYVFCSLWLITSLVRIKNFIFWAKCSKYKIVLQKCLPRHLQMGRYTSPSQPGIPTATHDTLLIKLGFGHHELVSFSALSINSTSSPSLIFTL